MLAPVFLGGEIGLLAQRGGENEHCIVGVGQVHEFPEQAVHRHIAGLDRLSIKCR